VRRAHPGFYGYILECADGTCYSGWTTNAARRLDANNRGQGAAYTRLEPQPDEIAALKRERAFKKWSHAQKQKRIRNAAP